MLCHGVISYITRAINGYTGIASDAIQPVSRPFKYSLLAVGLPDQYQEYGFNSLPSMYSTDIWIIILWIWIGVRLRPRSSFVRPKDGWPSQHHLHTLGPWCCQNKVWHKLNWVYCIPRYRDYSTAKIDCGFCNTIFSFLVFECWKAIKLCSYIAQRAR